jgi:zinc protease
MATLEIDRYELANGLSILGTRSSSASETVSISGSVKAGSIYDAKGSLGIAEAVARLLSRGTKSGESSARVALLIEEIGATLQFANHHEIVRFNASCHKDSLAPLLSILAKCLIEPAFSLDELDKVKSEIITDKLSEEDQTQAVASRELRELIFGSEQPFGRDPLGKVEDVKGLTREKVIEFYETHYRPDRVILAATGGDDFSRLKESVEREFGKWDSEDSRKKASVNDRETEKESVLQSREAVVTMSEKSQADIAMGFEAVPRTSKDYYALNLGNLVLGRLGLYGRLGKTVREEKGLAYYSFSSLTSRLMVGSLTIHAGVNPKNVRGTLASIAEELNRMVTTEIEEEELRSGQSNLVGSLSVSLDTSFDRANLIHDIEYYSLGEDYLSKYPSIIRSITKEEILRAFEKYGKAERLRLSVAGPVLEGSVPKISTLFQS